LNLALSAFLQNKKDKPVKEVSESLKTSNLSFRDILSQTPSYGDAKNTGTGKNLAKYFSMDTFTDFRSGGLVGGFVLGSEA
jgi:hypothetical protein